MFLGTANQSTIFHNSNTTLKFVYGTSVPWIPHQYFYVLWCTNDQMPFLRYPKSNKGTSTTCSRPVRPDLEQKVAQFFSSVAQKFTIPVFTLKLRFSKESKHWQILGLIFYDNFCPRPVKNDPIWSQCSRLSLSHIQNNEERFLHD